MSCLSLKNIPTKINKIIVNNFINVDQTWKDLPIPRLKECIIFNKRITVAAATVILLLNIIHSFSLGIGKSFQVWSTLIKLFTMILFIFVGIFFSDKQDISFIPKFEDLEIVLSPEFAINLVWVSYAYA